MNRFHMLFQRRVALAALSALVMGGLGVGVILVTAPAQSSTGTSSNASTTSSSSINSSTGTTSSSSFSNDGEHDGETGRALSGVVQQVDTGTGNFVLQDRHGASWTIMVTPNTQFVGISPSQIQPGQHLWVQGTVQSNSTVLATSILADGDDD